MEGLFGSEFAIDLTPKTSIRGLIKQINSSKSFGNAEDEAAITKILKSKRLSTKDQLAIIHDRVSKALKKQKNNVIVISSKLELNEYISKAISKGIIAVDTETNNSLDPVTCQLMGLCLYVPDEKQVYIPVNHVNYETGERLSWQLTELDCYEALKRVTESGIIVLMHNGKFDYEVLKETCGIEVVPTWDTIIAARLLNENENAGLKEQYVNKIDPTQEKYSLDKLFVNMPYAYVDPDIFALYAATDAYMTHKLYEIQYPEMTAPANSRLYWVFTNIEMPIVVITAEMELTGVCVDQNFGEKLRLKYNAELERVDNEIAAELQRLKPTIDKWRLSKDATDKSRVYPPKKSKKSQEAIEKEFPLIDSKTGERYKESKPKSEQLETNINLASPTQLAILFYDILHLPQVSKKKPRGTGEEELKALVEAVENMEDEELEQRGIKDMSICNLILDRRGIVKLLTTYIETIPTLTKHWPDGRIRFHLKSLGTDTGRYSSGGTIKYMDDNNEQIEVNGINIQNIPSHNKEIRLLFQAACKEADVIADDTEPFVVPEYTEVETPTGWVYPDALAAGDSILIDDSTVKIQAIQYNSIDKTYQIIA